VNEHEEKTVRAFVLKEKRNRCLLLLGNAKKRAGLQDRLNHTPDLDPRFVQTLPSRTDIPSTLMKHGSPAEIYLISAARELDGRMMALDEAIQQVEYYG